MKKFVTMGCGQSLSDEAQRNRDISKTLRKDFSMDRQIVKILLLGAGESGKSTVVKQMKLLHAVNDREGVGFSEEERSEARRAIYANIVDSITNILVAMGEFGIKFKSNMFEEDKEKVLNFAESANSIRRPSSDVVRAIENLWRNSEVQLAYGRRNEYQLNDSAAYFLSDVARFCKKDFEPNDQDILRTRVKTTGIVKIEFEFKSTTFHMFDVGGQRSERKKWIHCFDNVTAVLFIISLSEYDQVLFEDNSVNRMEESLQLFASVINNIHFKLMPFIVFFNKRDLFEEKLKLKGISLAFPDYDGDNSFDSARDFIVEKYLGQSKVSLRRRAIYPHLTTATDTELVNKVFTNVTEIILSEVLKDVGLN